MRKIITLFPALITVWLLCSALAPQHVPTVLILPFQINSAADLNYISDGMATLLPSRISMPGKISVVDLSTLKKSLGPDSLSSQESTIELARRLNADFILEGTITKIGSSLSVDSRIFEVQKPENSVPVIIQVSEIDRLIPETNAMADTVKEFILRSTGSKIPDKSLNAPAAQAKEPLPPSHIDGESLTETDMPSAALEPPETVQTPPEPVQAPPEPPKPLKPPLFETEPFMTHAIDSTAMQSITVADIDADGIPELVLATDGTIYFYNLRGTVLEKKHEIKTGISEHIVDISAADLNGNGVNELYVSCYEDRFATSFVLEKSATGFIRLAENLKWFFKAYEHPRDGVMLIGQKADSDDPFKGEIQSFIWQDGTLIPQEKITHPKELGIYAFSESDLYGDGSTTYLGFYKALFSQVQRLAMYSSKGRISWSDPLGLGGSPRTFVRYIEREDRDRIEVIPLRIICEDIDRDGTLDILIAKNIKKDGSMLGSFEGSHEGTLLSMNLDDLEMIPNWTSPVLNRYITDYSLADMDGDGSLELYILSVKSVGLIGNATNVVTGFRLAR